MRISPILATSAVLAACFLAEAGRQACATVVSIPASQDATLFGGPNDEANSSSGPGMFVGTDAQRLPKRGLTAFDVASYLPADATITDVSLSLVLSQVAGSGGGGGTAPVTSRTIRLYAVTTPWRGGTNGTTGYPGPGFGGTGQGFPANPGDVTWAYAAYNTRPWGTPGGDFVSAESADAVVGTGVSTAYTWGSTAQMVADVQDWLNGTTPNDGWLLKNDDETGQYSYAAFYTREGAAEQGVPQDAPALTVTYTVPVPEPPSLGLMLAGAGFVGAAQFRRRRRSEGC